MNDKALYQQIVDEITSGQTDGALWALAWTKAEGDDNKARSRYIEERVAELKRQTTKAATQRIRDEWRRELEWLRTVPLWGSSLFIIAANCLYASWCFHNPADTGVVALIGAVIGFNLFPLLVGAIILWIIRRQPQLFLKAVIPAILGVMTLILFLNCIDTENEFHVREQNTYGVTLDNGQPAYIDSSTELTAVELQNGVKAFSYQMREAAKEHQQALMEEDAGGWSYWMGQFSKGFESPFLGARCMHVHKSHQIYLALPK